MKLDDISSEQIKMLYHLLYPFIAEDFRHVGDCASAHQSLSEKLSGVLLSISSHSHGTGARAVLNFPAIDSSPGTQVADSYIIPTPRGVMIRKGVKLSPFLL